MNNCDIPTPLPSIGEIVHYYVGYEAVRDGRPLAGIVAALPSGPQERALGMISIVAFRPHRDNLHVTPVQFSATPRDGYWCRISG